MTMHWRKLGIVYAPPGDQDWASSHAMVPTPLQISPEVIRVFVTFCDANGLGRPGFVDVDANDPTRVLRVSERPLLDLGAPGSFDENGLLTCSVLPMGGRRLFLYYAGFELGTKIRYRLLTGLAISDDGGETFHRHSSVPVLERSDQERHIRGGPWALLDQGVVRLWYVAGSDWIELNGKSMPVYDLRYVESKDGVHFPSHGQVQLRVEEADEHGFGRPCVIGKPGGGFRLFYSVRRRSFAAYRLGYAESADGIHWRRMDAHLNLDVSPGEFDSDAIMYAAPIQIGEQLYVFYNGNHFGRDGFACARLERE
ncbi:hypothetical protein [Methylomonas sp. LWB]|uniref:hypothetical protein n=1 Tax=Methylomonas sp. LWB TaxID=1905845 RepID=UPI000ACD040A|nr:hypothetical protein [Methylomonas sp. LWB]